MTNQTVIIKYSSMCVCMCVSIHGQHGFIKLNLLITQTQTQRAASLFLSSIILRKLASSHTVAFVLWHYVTQAGIRLQLSQCSQLADLNSYFTLSPFEYDSGLVKAIQTKSISITLEACLKRNIKRSLLVHREQQLG